MFRSFLSGLRCRRSTGALLVALFASTTPLRHHAYKAVDATAASPPNCPPPPQLDARCSPVHDWFSLRDILQSAKVGADVVLCAHFHVIREEADPEIVIRRSIRVACAKTDDNDDACIIEGPGSHIKVFGPKTEAILQGLTFVGATDSSIITLPTAMSLTTICSCTFDGNVRMRNGGAIRVGVSTEVIIESCLFQKNSAHLGGAVYNRGILTVVDSTFKENSAVIGGSIGNSNEAFVDVASSTFKKNFASKMAPVIAVELGKPGWNSRGNNIATNNGGCNGVHDAEEGCFDFMDEMEAPPLECARREYSSSNVGNTKITHIASAYAAEHDGAKAMVRVPRHARDGDLLLLFIGGSAAGNARPSGPKPSSDWSLIFDKGPTDINLKAYHKIYSSDASVGEYIVSKGKNTYLVLSVLRGVHVSKPVVDSGTVKDSAGGSKGEAHAPAIYTVKNGAVVAAVMYDDPHEAILSSATASDGFKMLTSFVDGDDGIAVAVGPAQKKGGCYGPVKFEGAEGKKRGGGNEVTASVSLRPAE